MERREERPSLAGIAPWTQELLSSLAQPGDLGVLRSPSPAGSTTRWLFAVLAVLRVECEPGVETRGVAAFFFGEGVRSVEGSGTC